MKRLLLIVTLISLSVILMACGSSKPIEDEQYSLNDDEQYALDCVKQVPYVTEEDIADNLGEVYLAKGPDQSIIYAVVNYTTDYNGTTVYREAVFKDGRYYIDANDEFDTSDTTTSNLDKLIAQRDVRLIDMNEQSSDWNIVQIDPEVIKHALLDE